ncbi:MAG TPA: DegT/DnrJ/EryC1/StrS family aminotransferase [Noviherbaspirillum sp.]|uniref:DegT/DnrJ/EryC1/StrS family aminotransferase n=1 Tax=Noviherbaspirillum sp. TaxID=1926288 RepID=UPI002D4073AE|nr:DegT/DnrJ/EryC1/StrS family aminotransferase [Noviherbaspirillum sp.]HYD95289.1 DegT/DnrJ/EryC1/StrS family aminotransferase [Noviherbaspirillum sp.]
MSVPPLDLGAQYRQLRPALDAAIQRVLAEGNYIGGPEGEALEHELAQYLGVPEVVGVNSGTDALLLSLKALGVGAGDDVIVPGFTFFATAEAVSLAGARLCFADCAPGHFNIDAESVRQALTPRTKAVIAVHLFGQPVALDPLRDLCARQGLWLIEDAAQAIGARYRHRNIGSFGSTAAFSFYPTKNLGAFGDGGAIACCDPALAARLRRLRNHGRQSRYEHGEIGCNSRLDEIQAAILRVKLPLLDVWNEKRRRLAALYQEGLRDTACRWPPPVAGSIPVYHQFVVTHPERDALQAFLFKHGISSAVFYPIPCHLQPALAQSHAGLCLPRAERLAQEALALPIYPELSEESVMHITQLIRAFEGDVG